MSTERAYTFVEESGSAKRPRCEDPPSGKARRDLGRGGYTEVSKQAKALKDGIGACWRCRRYAKKCDEQDTCGECSRNSGFWGLHPRLRCRREKLAELAKHVGSAHHPDSRLPVHELISSMRNRCSKLSMKRVFKTTLYSRVLDIIDDLTEREAFFSSAFQYLAAAVELLELATQDPKSCPTETANNIIVVMQRSMTEVLQQLDKVMFKKTDSSKTLDILVAMCIIILGTEIWLLCLKMAHALGLNMPEEQSTIIQRDWLDTLVAVFSACKDLQSSGDIHNNKFEIIYWGDDAQLLLKWATNYGRAEPNFAADHSEGKLLWRLTAIQSRLCTAAADGNLDLVRMLYKIAPPTTIEAGSYWNELHWACNNGHITVVDLILQKGVMVDSRDIYKHTSLHLASQQGHDAVVKFLLQNGAEVNSKDYFRNTPLHLASQQGHDAVVKLLLQNEVEFNLVDEKGWTPLHAASQEGHVTIIKLLLEKGVDVNSKDEDGPTPLHLASQQGHDAVVKLLLQNEAEFNLVDEKGWTPLHAASQEGHVTIVKLLLEKGVDVNSKDENGPTPLHLASYQGHDAVVKLLLQNEAEFNLVDDEGWTLLHAASQEGYITIVKLLLEKGVDVNSKDENGYTPLHLASQWGHDAIVALLLQNEAEVNSEAENGCTPVHLASQRGHDATIALLLQNRAKMD